MVVSVDAEVRRDESVIEGRGDATEDIVEPFRIIKGARTWSWQ